MMAGKKSKNSNLGSGDTNPGPGSSDANQGTGRRASVLDRELARVNREAAGKGFTVSIEDLVMMQMVGDFDNFLGAMPSDEGNHRDFSAAERMIEETRGHVTTHSLFPSIVAKTIEAQVGEKHAGIREYGQNGMDSYQPGDICRRVDFSLRHSSGIFRLEARDYGCGMNVRTIVRDLLIPYNSGKELDINKIGEHGIGYWANADIALFLSLTSRPEGSRSTAETLIYRHKKNGKWLSTINPDSKTGLPYVPEVGSRSAWGTSAVSYIPDSATTTEAIIDHLYQYLGLISDTDGMIMLDGKTKINSVRGEYALARPVNIEIGGVKKSLTMGASKRKLTSSTPDKRFTLRDKNLERIVLTLRGQHTGYIRNPFNEKSLHYSLMQDLIDMGIDIWVDLPNNVTLTKGRNGIVADHQAPVLEAEYQAFENLFLDVILEDEELLASSQGSLLDSIAEIFTKRYAQKVEFSERNSYTLGKKVATKTAALASATIDFSVSGAKYVGKFISGAAKYTVKELPEDIAKFAKDRERQNEILKAIGGGIWNLTKWTVPRAAMTFGVGYGLYELINHFGADQFLYLCAAAGVGCLGVGIYKVAREIKNIASESEGGIGGLEGLLNASNSLGRSMAEGMRNKYLDFMHHFGLYLNMEEKRELAREKQVKRISGHYLSAIGKDEFLGKILDKEIIPALQYYRPSEEDSQEGAEPATIGGLLASGKDNHATYGAGYYGGKHGLRCRDMKISIDQIVNLFIKNKLRYERSSQDYSPMISDGDVEVDVSNPLVRTVITELERVKHMVRSSYDPLILEDHLDNIGEVLKAGGFLLYMLSGVGIVHSILSGIDPRIRNPIDGFKPYQAIKASLASVKEKYNGTKFADSTYRFSYRFMEIFNSAALAALSAPAYIVTMGATGLYTKAIVPAARFMNPKNYSSHARATGEFVSKTVANTKLRIEESSALRKKRIKEKKRLKEIHAQYENSSEPSRLSRLAKQVSGAISEAYYKGMIYELFGSGIRGGDTFDDVGLDKLEMIEKITGMGGMYVSFMRAAEGIEGLIADAISELPLKIVMSHSYNYEEHVFGFRLDEKNVLHIDTEALHRLNYTSLWMPYLNFNPDKSIPDLANSRRRRESDLDRVAYSLLEMLIHLRAHTKPGQREHRDSYASTLGYHREVFYVYMREIRSRVVDYLVEKDISLTDYVGNYFPAQEAGSSEHEKNMRLAYVPPTDLTMLIHMTRPTLLEEGVSHRLRDEILARK